MMLASSHKRTLGCVAAFLIAILPCISQTTLREQLHEEGIPESSFSKAELDETVDGTGSSKQSYVYFVYQQRNVDSPTNFPRLVRYDQNTGEILRSELPPKEEDPYCCGAPLGIKFIDDYLLAYFHFNPSASAILVADKNLKHVRVLDGIDVMKVATNQIVVVENTVHFAPVHPERLQWLDLGGEKDLELYPLKNDALRNRFEAEYVKRMPAVCKQSDEICDYGRFDEGCTYLGGDGQSKVAFACGRVASYQAKAGEEKDAYFADSAIYLYAHNSKGWVYCEQAISKDESAALDKEETKGYEKIKSRCTPKLPVIPADTDR